MWFALLVGQALASTPSPWRRVAMPPGHEASFTVALHPSNMGTLDRLLDEVSDPDALNYGEYLTKSEVPRIKINPFRPRTETAAGARARPAVRPLAFGLFLVLGDSRQCS
jgi:hypothetical protein